MRLKPKDSVLAALKIIADHVDEHLNNKCSINTGLIANQLIAMCSDNTRFKVNIVKLDVRKSPFIMCVYPEPDELDRLSKPLVNAINEAKGDKFIDEWFNIRSWTIEIDSRLITKGNRICVDNGSQFVAILCHEIDHVLYTHPYHLVYNYNMHKARMNMYQKMVMNKASISKVFLPMFVCISGLRVLVKQPLNQVEEIRMDSHIPKEYQGHLVDYIEKHVITNPDTSDVIKTYEEFDTEQTSGVVFTAECVRLMAQRKSILKAQIMAQYKLSPNGYFKDVCKKVLKGISGTNPETGKIDLTKESYINKAIDRDLEGLQESVEFILEGKNIDDRDIILLIADADSISTTADKTYVLNTAFDYMETLNKKRNKILNKTTEKDPAKLAALTKYEDMKIAQLNDLVKSVMHKKVTYYGDHYGVFVKYPEGYEG